MGRTPHTTSFPVGKPAVSSEAARAGHTEVKRQCSRGPRKGCFLKSCLSCFASLPLSSHLFVLGDEIVWVCKLSPGNGARLCVINRNTCQSLQRVARLPRKPGLVTRSIQYDRGHRRVWLLAEASGRTPSCLQEGQMWSPSTESCRPSG